MAPRLEVHEVHLRDRTERARLGEAEELIRGLAAKTAKDAFLVLYCSGFDCHDSKTLGDKLIQAGFRQVFVFEGGFPEWRDAGYPVDKENR